MFFIHIITEIIMQLSYHPKFGNVGYPKIYVTIVSISPGGYYVVPRESKAMVMQFFGGGVQLMVNT